MTPLLQMIPSADADFPEVRLPRWKRRRRQTDFGSEARFRLYLRKRRAARCDWQPLRQQRYAAAYDYAFQRGVPVFVARRLVRHWPENFGAGA